MKNKSLLLTSIKTLARDYKKFLLSFFGVMTLMYLIEFIVAIYRGKSSIGGIEYVYFIACLVAGLISFKEDYYFLSQNQVPKATIRNAFIIEGFCFALVTGFTVNIYFHIIKLISGSLKLESPGFLALTPSGAEEGGFIGFVRTFVILFFLYAAVYFFGLLLSTINYRLNWLGRVAFWVPFGIAGFYGFFGSLDYIVSKTNPEESLEMPSLILAKPFTDCLDWFLRSLGNFVVGSAVLIVICVVLGAVIFRKAEIKYSNIK